MPDADDEGVSWSVDNQFWEDNPAGEPIRVPRARHVRCTTESGGKTHRACLMAVSDFFSPKAIVLTDYLDERITRRKVSYRLGPNDFESTFSRQSNELGGAGTAG